MKLGRPLLAVLPVVFMYAFAGTGFGQLSFNVILGRLKLTQDLALCTGLASNIAGICFASLCAYVMPRTG